MSMWGGRFESPMSDIIRAFTFDDSDRRLLEFDIAGSIAHAEMLGECGIVTDLEASEIVEGLRAIRSEGLEFSPDDEDVHSAVERRLTELIGAAAGKLHTGRSRNDQVSLDLRLYLAAAGDERSPQLHELIGVLVGIAETHVDMLIPSYTHTQQAQVTTLGHHLLAHAWALVRDIERLSELLVRHNQSPLGAGASAGSSLPLDRSAVAEKLGMAGVIPNSIDAVGSRDFVAEYVFICAQTLVDLSRLAEEIVLWSTSEFGWVTLGDDVSTGSSALPHKRNPDIAELIRGKSATVIGDVSAILALQKGLPLSYNRDFQEDKRILFHADDTLAASLDAMTVLLGGIEFHIPSPTADVTAPDLAEALVARGVPFREAHGSVGRLVRSLESDGRSLREASLDDLVAVDSRFEATDLALVDPAASMGRRVTEGSGNAESVRAQIEQLRLLLD